MSTKQEEIDLDPNNPIGRAYAEELCEIMEVDAGAFAGDLQDMALDAHQLGRREGIEEGRIKGIEETQQYFDKLLSKIDEKMNRTTSLGALVEFRDLHENVTIFSGNLKKLLKDAKKGS